MHKKSIEQDIAKYMKLLCANDLTTSSGGNISVRSEGGGIFITPSGQGKNVLDPSDVVRLEPEMPVPAGRPGPSIEADLHLCIYSVRADVNAIIHAHPLFATAFLATERQIDFDLTAESRVMIGSTAEVPFAPAGSSELAASVSEAVKGADLVLLHNHGIIAVGSSLQEAYNRVELAEAAAKTTFIGEVAGDRRDLSPAQLDLIDLLLGNERME